MEVLAPLVVLGILAAAVVTAADDAAVCGNDCCVGAGAGGGGTVMFIGESIWYLTSQLSRSEERRVGKECRSRWSPYH